MRHGINIWIVSSNPASFSLLPYLILKVCFSGFLSLTVVLIRMSSHAPSRQNTQRTEAPRHNKACTNLAALSRASLARLGHCATNPYTKVISWLSLIRYDSDISMSRRAQPASAPQICPGPATTSRAAHHFLADSAPFEDITVNPGARTERTHAQLSDACFSAIARNPHDGNHKAGPPVLASAFPALPSPTVRKSGGGVAKAGPSFCSDVQPFSPVSLDARAPRLSVLTALMRAKSLRHSAFGM